MVTVLAGLGVAGWSGIGLVGALLVGASQLGRRKKAKADGKSKGDAGGPVGPQGPGDTPPSREMMLAAFAEARGSQVVPVIHHDRYEMVDDLTATRLLDTLRKAGPDAAVDIILHTPGGYLSPTQQILHALKNHPGRKTAFIPYKATSAGTMIALACDEIILGPSASMGPIDPQLWGMPAAVLAGLPEKKSADRIDDEYLIVSEMAKQALKEARRFACEYVNEAHMMDGSCSLTDDLIDGGRNHDYPLLPDEAEKMGINVAGGMPDIVFDICTPPEKEQPVFILELE